MQRQFSEYQALYHHFTKNIEPKWPDHNPNRTRQQMERRFNWWLITVINGPGKDQAKTNLVAELKRKWQHRQNCMTCGEPAQQNGLCAPCTDFVQRRLTNP